MESIRNLLAGNKTYIVAALAVIYELLSLYFSDRPIDTGVIVAAILGATVRAGMKKDTKEAKEEVKDHVKEVKSDVKDVKYDVKDVKQEVNKINPAL